MATAPDDLAPYLDRLRDLPFVRAARTRALRGSERGADAALTLQTPDGRFELAVEQKRSHLGRELAEAVLARHARDESRWIVVAPSIGGSIADLFASAGMNFVDRDGNCYLNLDDRYVARLQRAARTPRPASEGGIRAPGYQVLFALLAEDELRLASVRALADAASVSLAPAHQMRARLVERGLAWRRHDGLVFWVPERWKDAVDLFVGGYATFLRRKLLIGTYRMQEREPDACERRIEEVMGESVTWAFGGGSAAARLTGHYHGPRVTLHVDDMPANRLRALRAVPDREGPLVVLRTPGAVGMRGPQPHVAHPLLVHAELLVEGGERAREAATEVLERWRESGS